MATLESVTLRNNIIRNQLKYDTDTKAHMAKAKIAAEKALIDHKLQEKLEALKSKPYNWKLGNFDAA